MTHGRTYTEEFQRILRAAVKIVDQTELAPQIGVAQGTISKWLSGTHSPNIENFDALVDAVWKNPKTRHLIADPDSLDRMVASYDSTTKSHARKILASYLESVPEPRHDQA